MGTTHSSIISKVVNHYLISGDWAHYDQGHTPAQGWNLYIACREVDAERVADEILPMLRQNIIAHKVFTGSDRGQEWAPEQGRDPFIIIHCRSGRHARHIAEEVDRMLASLNLDPPKKSCAGTAGFGQSGLLRYRYGVNFDIKDIALDERILTRLSGPIYVSQSRHHDLLPDDHKRAVPYFIEFNPFDQETVEFAHKDFCPSKEEAQRLCQEVVDHNIRQSNALYLYIVTEAYNLFHLDKRGYNYVYHSHSARLYEALKDKCFNYHTCNMKDAPHQGWVIEIPLSLSNGRDVAEKAIEILVKMNPLQNPPHIMRNQRSLSSGDLRKFISVHCRNAIEARLIAEELDRALRDAPLPEHLREMYEASGEALPFGESGNVWYRYTVSKWHKNIVLNRQLIDQSGKLYPAEEAKVVPDFIDYDPFKAIPFDPDEARARDFSPSVEQMKALHKQWCTNEGGIYMVGVEFDYEIRDDYEDDFDNGYGPVVVGPHTNLVYEDQSEAHQELDLELG